MCYAPAPVHPVFITVASVPVKSYTVFVAMAFVVAYAVRKMEARRLGLAPMPGYAWVGVGCLLGAVAGAKLGLLLFVPAEQFASVLGAGGDLDFSGKTVLGALAGGYMGVEVAKKVVGIRVSTGDSFAVAVPLGQAVGRLGCLFNGCCYGTPTQLPWGVQMAGAVRHPVQLYEAGLDLALAALLWGWRGRRWPQGHLFRRYLVGYACIRLVAEHWRGDPTVMAGPLTLAQWFCLAVAVVFAALIVRGERRVSPQPNAPG